MSRNECNCRHASLQKIKNKIYICKECSVLAFNSSKNNNASYNYFIKPKIFNKKAEENPIEIFNAIYDKSILNKNEIQFSEIYRTYRPKLLSYIKKMCISYRLSTKAYYLSICYLDIASSKIQKCNPYLLDVYATCCFILAMKFIELDPPTPNYKNFKGIEGKNAINSADLYKYEIIILKELHYHLDVVTAYDILCILFVCGIVCEDEISSKPNEFIRNVYNYTKKIVDKSIENDSISEKYNSIQIAFSAIYIARRLYGLNIQCRKHFKSIYEVGFSYYSSCVRAISNLDNPEGNNICNTEQVSHRLKKIRVIEDEPIMIYEPEEKVNHSYAKSMVKPKQWKPLVLPFIESAKKNNLYELMQTEPSRNKHGYSNSISSLKSLKEVDNISSLTNKLKLNKFISAKQNYEARSSTNLRGLIKLNELKKKDNIKHQHTSKFKLPKI